MLHESQRLDGLAQPHVVGEARAQAPPPQEAEPRVSSHLVRTQDPVEVFRRSDVLECVPSVQLGEQIGDPSRGGDAVEGDRSRCLSGSQSHLHDLAHGGLAGVLFLPEVEGRLDLLGAHLHPLAAHVDQGGLESRQCLKLLV